MVWWNPRKSASTRVGLEFLPDAVTVACSTGVIPDATITSVAMLPCAPGQRQAVLADYVQEQGIENASCSVVLSPDEYQLLLVEAPDVPDEEMRAALRWRLKDLLNVPLDAAAIDVFNLPADATRSGKRMVFVVASELAKVQKLLALVRAAGLRPSVIDINEMALRNLTLCLSQEQIDARGVVLVRASQGAGSLGFYRDGNLYLSRQFELNYGGGLLDDLPDEDLVLEIQRSLDYSERQMGQAPPAAIYICGDNISEDKITDTIKQGLAAPVAVLPMASWSHIDCDQEEPILQACAGAIGGVLRREEWA